MLCNARSMIRDVCSIRLLLLLCKVAVCFFKQKTAYEMRISDWSSDVCSSDLSCCPSKSTCSTHRCVVRHGKCTEVPCVNARYDDIQDEIGRASCRERVCQYV